MPSPRRNVAALIAALALTGTAVSASAAPPPRAHPEETPSREIVISVNGQELGRDPAPRFVGSRLLVPVVRIYNALGIEVTRSGDDLYAAAPSKKIRLHINSAQATIDQRTVRMDAPARELDGATFVSLRFVADSLGAYVTYDPKAYRVDVVSSLVGRNPGLEQRTATGTQLNGTVTAVDLVSAPESVTVAGRNGEVRTISLTSDAQILIQDTVAKTSENGSLNDVRPGDAVSIVLRKDGRVAQVIDRFATRSGSIAAISGNAFVLRDGYVVTPDRGTTVTLDGKPGSFGDLRAGDNVAVRINPDTLEKRQIIAFRPTGQAPASASPGAAPSSSVPPATASVRIDGVTTTSRAYHGGETLPVTVTGTPGGRATFDVGSLAAGVPMTETRPGTYAGEWKIPAGADLGAIAVVGHLRAGDAAARATRDIVIVSTPPQVIETAPKAGEVVPNDKPSIFATYRSPSGVAIDPSSVTLEVNGKDVTAQATRAAGFVTYSPGAPLGEGTVTVTVRVEDVAKNPVSRTWTFTIRTK